MKRPPQNPKHESEDRLRLIAALLLSLAVLIGFSHFVDKPMQEKAAQQRAVSEKAAPATVAAEAVIVPRAEAVAASGGRIRIDGARVSGSIALKGARIDDILLKEHYTTVARDENVALLSPSGTQQAYYVEGGWIAAGGGVKVPDAESVWHKAAGSAPVLKSGGAPVVLEWNNGEGLVFRRKITLDDNYLFSVTQEVVNNSGRAVRLSPYQLAARHSLPDGFSGFFVLHEGPIGFLKDEVLEPSYKDLAKGEVVDVAGTDGWLGISDKYWLVALLPGTDESFNARMVAAKKNGGVVYQTDAVLPVREIAAGGSASETSHAYVGVKDLDVMRAYQKQYGFKQLELGIDFGMWSFITKPFFLLLHWLIDTFGNVGLAILLMTVVVRTAVFPLASKSFRSMAKMKIVAPKMKELQEKHKDDKAALQMAIFELYQKEDVNPFSGCWPLLVQIPIFFALYKVILVSVDLRHAPFWGWIDDLSAPDPTSIFNLFGLLPFTPPQVLMIGAWPLLFCLSMILQKRITPPMTDPIQEKLQTWFPYIVTVMLAHFAVGLVIYWTWSNLLGTLQQYYILKKVGGEDTSLLRGHAGRRKKKEKKKG